MGGLREETVQSPKMGGLTSGYQVEQSGDLNPIRFHENSSTGQVHFHDDKLGLKVAMPIATWYVAWQKIKQANNSIDAVYVWTYIDSKHNTLLTVKCALDKCSLDINDELEVILIISPIKQGETFQKLDKFMPEKGKN